jgi:hypothetical protein
LQTVAETSAYLAAADQAGMTEADRWTVIDLLAANPSVGELMVGTGGCRKFRLAGRGKGKSGGYRIITYFGGDDMPVYLLTVFSKGERANLSRAECNALSQVAKRLRASAGPRPRRRR